MCTAQSRLALFFTEQCRVVVVSTAQFREALCVYCTV